MQTQEPLIGPVDGPMIDAFMVAFRCGADVAKSVLDLLASNSRETLMKDDYLWDMIMQRRPHYLLGDARLHGCVRGDVAYAKAGHKLVADLIHWCDNYQH